MKRALFSVVAASAALALYSSSALADEPVPSEAPDKITSRDTQATDKQESAAESADESGHTSSPDAVPPVAAAPDAPPASVVPAASSARRASPNERDAASTSEVIDTFRIGPMVGVGFPRPFNVELFAKYKDVVGLGVEYGFMPRLTVATVDASFYSFAADARVFPFRGGFFVGVRGGRQWLDGKTSLSAGSFGTLRESVAASTWFVNPRAGFLFTFKSGITLGIDAGVHLPVNPEYSRTSDAGQLDPLIAKQTAGTEDSVAAVVKTLGNGVTPTVDLLRLGYLF